MADFGKMTKLRMNHTGAKALLNDQKVVNNLRARAERLKSALPTNKGEKWEVVALRSKDRQSFMVRAANTQARKTAAEDHVLQRNLGAAK